MPFARSLGSARSFLFLITLSTFGVLASITANAADTLVATLPGEFSVDNKGSANYSIPLVIPPGRQGMQPKLSLNYSSSGGNGPLGVGFSLSTGFPQSISRGRSILARDGVTRGVNFDDTNPDPALRDKFYLDGKRLICVAGSYGQPGSVYRTEVDSFVTITTNATGSTIETFVMVDKSGTKMTFGKTSGTVAAPDGFQTGMRLSDTQIETVDTLAYTWALKRVEDTIGNFCSLTYTNAGGGEWVLTKLEYTWEPGATTAPQTVELLYNTGTVAGVSSRRDASNSYVAWRRFAHAKRLDAVVVSSLVPTSTEVARYTLTYGYAPNQGRTRLEQITGSFLNGIGGTLVSAPATVIGWSDTALSSPGDTSVVSTLPKPPEQGTSGYNKRVFGDFNGDGREDYVEAASGGLQVYLGQAGGGFATTPALWMASSQYPAKFGGNQSGSNGSLFVIDIDSDGMKDLLLADWQFENLYAVRSTGSGFQGLTGVSVPTLVTATGNVFKDPTLEGPTGSLLREMENGAMGSRVTAADFNGDGREDVILHGYDGSINLLVSNGAGFAALKKTSASGHPTWVKRNVDCALRFQGYEIPDHYTITAFPCDLNGDGRSDYVWIESNRELTSSYQFSTSLNVAIAREGNDFVVTSVDGFGMGGGGSTKLGLSAVTYNVFPGDFNGDGLTDLLVQKGDSPDSPLDWNLHLSQGSGTDGVWLWKVFNEIIPSSFTYGGQELQSYYLPVDADAWDARRLFSPWSIPDTDHKSLAHFFQVQSSGNHMFPKDVNRDGLSDMVWYGWSKTNGYASTSPGWWVAYASGTGFAAPTPLTGLRLPAPSPMAGRSPTHDGGLSAYSVREFDINGDGLPDTLVDLSHDGKAEGPQYWVINGGSFGDLVTSVTDGLSRKTEIAYKAAKDDAVYTPGAAVTYPIRELRASSPVVAEVWKDSGSGVPADRANFSYQYSGNRLDLSGRGGLGFHSFVTLDRGTKLFKYQFLAQSFPMTGLTAREQTYRWWDDATTVSFRLINSHDNTVVFDEVVKSATDNTPWGTVYPFISKAVESRWEDHLTQAHFGPWAKTGSPESMSELLFTKALPPDAHITVTATSQFDNQTAVQLTNPTSTDTNIQASYVASDAQLVGSGASAKWQSVVVGSPTPAAYAKLTFNRLITYGNLTKLTTDYGDSSSETVNTTYHPPSTVGGLTGLAKDVITTVGAPAPYNTAADTNAPTKSYTYWENGSTWTPLVATEVIDVDRDGAATSTLDLETKYVRDSRGRVQETQLIGKVDSTAPTTSSTLTVSKVTRFNDRFDLPEVVENAYGHATTTGYHEFLGLPISVTDVNTAKIETDYDALGRAIQTRDLNLGLQSDTTFALTSATASDWKKTQPVAVPSGVSGGLTLSSAYAVRTTATSRTVAEVSLQPPVTTYFDRLGRTIRTVREGFADQKTTTDTIYNKLGQVVAISLPYAVGATPVWTRTTYDKLGRVDTITAPNLTVTTNTYSGRATQVSVNAPSLGGIDPPAQVNTTLVDAKGRTIKVWNADNVPDALDLPTLATKAASVEYKLDGFGRMRSTALLANSTGPLFTTVTASYDALGRQSELNDPDKGSWKYTNNVLGQVVRQEDARQTVTTSTFDPLGRPLTRTTTEPSSGPVETASWYYYDTATNVAGRPTMHLFAKGEQGWIGALQREEASTPAAPGYAFSDPAAGKAATFHYFDAKGRPSITLTTIDKKWFYTCTDYDAAGRVGSVRNFWKPSGYEAPTNKPYMWQDFGYSYKYDSKSYLLELRDSSGQVWWEADTSAGYDHLDRPALVRKGHGHWTKRTYRPEDGVLTTIQTGPTPGSATVQNLGFTFDGLGNLTKRTDGAPLNGGSALSETFGYDNLNRLTHRNGAEIVKYAINGNVSSKSDVNGNSSGNYVYGGATDHPHAVTSAFGYAMTYDFNGNLLTRTNGTETWSTKWAGFDKPRWLAKTAGTSTVGSEFLYNANRSRVIQAEFDSMGGTPAAPVHYNRKRIYAWGASGEIDYKNLNPTGGANAANWQLDTIRLYVPGPDGVIGAMEFAPNSPPEQITKSKRSLVYHYDHLGSVDTVTLLGDRTSHVALDDTGKQARHSFDPWGQRRDPNDWDKQPVNTTIGGHADVTPRGFTGHEMMDNLGSVVNMNGRIYDALLGCFMSADLLVSNPGNLQSFNRYSYCGNNPLNTTDPSGFQSVVEEARALARQKAIENRANGGESPADRIRGNSAPGNSTVASNAASAGARETDTAPTPAVDEAKPVPEAPEVPKDAPPTERADAEKGSPNSETQFTLSAQATPYPVNNTGETIIVVTPGGNALPVPPGGTIAGSPNGEYIDVKGPNGQTTGNQIHGGHKPNTHPNPRGQKPHAHRPGITNPDGTPWLPVHPEPPVVPQQNPFVSGFRSFVGEFNRAVAISAGAGLPAPAPSPGVVIYGGIGVTILLAPEVAVPAAAVAAGAR